MGADARLTADHGLIRDAAAVVLPGVGAFGACMDALRRAGLADGGRGRVRSGRPFLGICVGMQLLYEGSEESPGVPGLGVLPGILRLLPDTVKRPQMQWNLLDIRRPSGAVRAGRRPGVGLLRALLRGRPADDAVVATCDYGGPVAAAVERGVALGHPVPPREVRRHRPRDPRPVRGRAAAASPGDAEKEPA